MTTEPDQATTATNPNPPGATSQAIWPPKLTRDQLWGICTGLMLVTNADQTCRNSTTGEREPYDIYSAIAAVEASLDGEGLTLNELYANLMRSATRTWT